MKLEDLRTDHPSVPYNPLLAESLYLTRYIERAGSGTQAIIALCREAGLPEPQFEQRSGSFVITLWRDRLTAEIIMRLDLSENQKRALAFVKSTGRITNKDYRGLSGVIARTASRNLDDLVQKGVLEKIGTTGRGTYYVLGFKQDKKPTNRT